MPTRTLIDDTTVHFALRAGRIDLLIDGLAAATRVADRRFLLSALERAVELADPGALGEGERDLCRTAGVADAVLRPTRAEAPPHAVRVPLVEQSSGEGFVRLMYVSYQPHGAPHPFGVQAARAVEAGLRAAAAEAGIRYVEDYAFVPAQPRALSDVPIDGDSLGAAAFVSALSLFTHRAVLPGTAVTGSLEGELVGVVGHVTDKLRGATRGRSDVTRLVLPEPARRALGRRRKGDVDLHGVETLADLAAATLEPRPAPARDPDHAVYEERRRYRDGWNDFGWPALRERLERLCGAVPDHRPDLHVQALTMLGAVMRHLGDPMRSLSVLAQARAVAESEASADAMPDAPVTMLYRHLALTHLQLCHFPLARDAARRAVEVAKAARLRPDLLKGLGTAGIVARCCGEPALAAEHHRAAIELALRGDPAQAARSAAYLVEALGHAGHVGGAREAYAQAETLIAQYTHEGRRRGETAWLRTAHAGALLRNGRPEEALALLEVPAVAEAIADKPMPGLLARRWLGVARARLGDPTGYTLLASSPAAYGATLQPHLSFLAHANVLHEARERALAGRLDHDAAVRAQSALAHLPAHGDAVRFLGEAATRVFDALDERRDAVAALTELLHRCERVG